VTPEDRAQILVTSHFLRAIAILRWFAIALTIVAAFFASTAIRVGVVVAGAFAIYYGIRASFDAQLLDDIAAERLATEELDRALGRFAKESRPWPERCKGARRLALSLIAFTVLELIAVTIGFR
jgi:uncharacterized membrane protein